MHSFVRNLLTEWRRLELPASNAAVVMGVSGGADSVSLLLAMHDLVLRQKLELRLVAAHFNHSLRGAESDADEDLVKHLTTERRIELAVKRGKIPADGNLEQNARQARYGFLRLIASEVGAFAVLTGHTVNDQAETFLMNLIRGSGPAGLGAMRAVRELGGETASDAMDAGNAENADGPTPYLPFSETSPLLLVRPLLTWAKRGETEAFCRDSGVDYRYDTMNEDTAFRRVRIRKVLLPLLEDMNPRIVDVLASTASLMQAGQTAASRSIHSDEPDELIIAELRQLAPGEFYRRVRSWLSSRRGGTRQLQLKHITAVERLVNSTKSGRTAEIPGGRVLRSGGRLRYEENKVEN